MFKGLEVSCNLPITLCYRLSCAKIAHALIIELVFISTKCSSNGLTTLFGSYVPLVVTQFRLCVNVVPYVTVCFSRSKFLLIKELLMVSGSHGIYLVFYVIFASQKRLYLILKHLCSMHIRNEVCEPHRQASSLIHFRDFL